MKKLLLTLSLAFLFATGAIGQTNDYPPTPTAPPITTNAVPDVGTAIANLVHALFPKFSMAEIVEIVAGIFLLARTLRKIIPDKMQTGKFGQVLRHAALQVNPPPTEALKENPTTNTPAPAPPVPPKS